MPNDKLQQLAEKAINDYFGKRLSPEQHHLAVQIAKEIYLEPQESKVSLDEWQAQVTQFDHNLQTRLKQAATPAEQTTLRFAILWLQQIAGEAAGDIFANLQQRLTYTQRGMEYAQAFLTQGETDASVRENVLILYLNAGLTQGQLGQPQAALDTFQQGLHHAQAFLTQGKTDTLVREGMLRLYDAYSITYYKNGQTALVIPLLPFKGLWSWVALNQVAKSEHRKTLLHNWQKDLEIAHSSAQFTAAFQNLLHQLITVWHSPQRKHRHFGFLDTRTLLKLSESLYAVTQAQDNRQLQTVYQRFAQLAQSSVIQTAQALHHQQRQRKQRLDTLNQSAWFYRWQRAWYGRQLLEARQRYEQQSALARQDEDWRATVRQTKQALVTWLQTTIHQHLSLASSELETLPEIALGILCISHSLQTGHSPENLLATWQTQPPWQDATTLAKAFATSDWQTWANTPNMPLYCWIGVLEKHDIARRLRVTWEQQNQAQPTLNTWLQELAKGNAEPLAQQLDDVWKSKQKPVDELAPILGLLRENLSGFLFDKRDTTETTKQQALTALVLGDVSRQITHALETWFEHQAPIPDNLSVLETFQRLKQRWTKAASIYQKPHAELGKVVHDWAKALLKEMLATTPTGIQSFGFEETPGVQSFVGKASQTSTFDSKLVWEILERARVGLTGLQVQLPENWEEDLGKQLWQDLDTSIRWLREGFQPGEEDMWPLLATWLERTENWLKKPPSVQECQQYLSAQEALVQPFFVPKEAEEEGLGYLWVLWLDKEKLEVRDLPADCASESFWTAQAQDSVASQWTRGFQEWKARHRSGGQAKMWQDWSAVMRSDAVQSFANQLQQWADGLTRLTIIFPAPLGQLPWESLESLQDLLVREVSVEHWLNIAQHTPDEPNNQSWVVCDPSGEAECMVKEARWVAKHFETTLQAPCPSAFDMLQNLEKPSQRVHLATHGEFVPDAPTRSYLSLNQKKGQFWPLWMITATRIKTDFIMLSACESNLSGPETEGLLTPIGIGPSFLAAGAKTVVGTLWPCDGLAALCFSHYFYQIAQDNSEMPWHHVVAQARQSLRQMQRQDLENIIEQFQLRENNQLCYDKSVDPVRSRALFQKPFQDFAFWSGFTVFGKVERD